MKLHLFNPENDLALADGGANYCPPPAAAQIAYDLASLPLWFAGIGNAVALPDGNHLQFREDISNSFNVALPYEASMVGKLECCRPWGWSAQMKRRFKAMGVPVAVLPSDEAVEPFTFVECMDVLRQQVRDSVEWLGERPGILHVRRHLAATPLLKGLTDFRPLRIAMLRAEKVDELMAILDEIVEKYGV